MLRKIRIIAASLALLAGILAPAALPAAPTYAASSASKTAACNGIGLTGAACGNRSTAQGRVSGLVTTIIRVLSYFVGVAALIMIIISGFKYVTGGGDPQKVAGAKNTLIYAIVGLVIVALAQVIVRFVLKSV